MNQHTHCKILRKRGAAVITAVIFFVIISTTVALGLSSPVVREHVTVRDFEKSKGAYYLSEAGIEDVLYRFKKVITVDSSQEVLSLGGNTATTTITNNAGNKKTISTVGDISNNTRRTKSTLSTITGVAFVYGLLAGTGGVDLQNTSTITGNLYSAGPVTGAGGNVITGSVISSGTSGTNGTISGVQNLGGNHMYAGTIANSTISGNAYCVGISGSTPNTCNTLSLQPPADLPISAQDIANWETSAATSTVTCSSGKYTISTSVDFGPVKVPCDLVFDGSGGSGPTVTLKGPVWVTGNIETKNSMTIRVDPTKVGEGMVIIADNPSNRTTSSKIELKNTPLFVGAPGGNSYVLMISENSSASTGGSEKAISLVNGADGDLLVYARLGEILIQNTSSVSEVTGYKITLQNSANVTYSTGLQNALFSTGPGGAWEIQDWKEGQ